MPILNDNTVVKTYIGDCNVKIFRMNDDYEVDILNVNDQGALIDALCEVLQNPIKVENLELDYCRNIYTYMQVGGPDNNSFPITKTRHYHIKYDKCVFTNPNKLRIREHNCRGCYYL